MFICYPLFRTCQLLASYPSLRISAFLQMTGKTECTVRNCKLTKFFLDRNSFSQKSENIFLITLKRFIVYAHK